MPNGNGKARTFGSTGSSSELFSKVSIDTPPTDRQSRELSESHSRSAKASAVEQERSIGIRMELPTLSLPEVDDDDDNRSDRHEEDEEGEEGEEEEHYQSDDDDSIAVGRRHLNIPQSAPPIDIMPRDSQMSLIREFADVDTSGTGRSLTDTNAGRGLQPNQDMFSVLAHCKTSPPKLCTSPSSSSERPLSIGTAQMGNLDGRCRGETGDLEGIVPLRNGRLGIQNPQRANTEPTWLDLHRAKKKGRGIRSLKNMIKLK